MTTRRARAITLAVALAAVVALPAGAGAATEDIKVCKLLTKKEASRILGVKVVTAEAERDKVLDAAECDWKTKKFIDEDMRDLDAPIQLSLDIQGIDDELRAELEQGRLDGDEIDGLGDFSFRTSAGATIAVSGDIALEGSYSNAGSTPSDVAAEKETAALRLAISRLPKA